jgi:hypothetical protein
MTKKAFVMLAAATLLTAQSSSDQYDFDQFNQRWNEVAAQWNDISPELTSGKYPLGKLQRLDKAIERLRSSRLWPRGREH